MGSDVGQTSFEMQLRKLLEAEPRLRSEIVLLVQKFGAQQTIVIVNGDGAGGIGGNASGVSVFDLDARREIAAQEGDVMAEKQIRCQHTFLVLPLRWLKLPSLDQKFHTMEFEMPV